MSDIGKKISHPFKYSKYKQSFIEHSKQREQGLKLFLKEQKIEPEKTFDFYELVYNNSKTIVDYDLIIREYNIIYKKYKIGVVEVIGNDNSISTMKLAIAKKDEIIHATNVCKQFQKLQPNFQEGISFLLQKKSTNYTLKQKEQVVEQIDYIKELDALVKKVFSYEHTYPLAWQQFICSLNGDISGIYKIGYEKLKSLNQSNFSIKNKFLLKAGRFSLNKLNLILGSTSHNAKSFDERTILEEKNFLNNISSYPTLEIKNLNINCRHSSKNEFIRALYDSTYYSNEVTFVDSYTYYEFYNLGKVIESYNTTFDKIYYFRKNNADAVKAYNKQTSGKECFYIQDFELIAKKDIALMDFVNNFNEKKARKQEEERKKREEEERNRKLQKAKELASNYPLGFKHYFPNLSSYSITHSNSQEIIWKEHDIIEYHNYHTRIKQALSNWDSVKGIPYYFFYYYYPTRFIDVSSTSDEARRMIWNFKYGISQSKVIDLIISKITSTFSSSDVNNFTFVCIPASTISDNICRYKNFSEKVCSTLNMRNSFDFINITKEKTSAHLNPDHIATSAEYSFTTSFFNGAKVILFDDVVTRGHSMQFFKETLESLGATIICAISIGRTYSDYYGDNRKPHPYTGRL